jgi:hypothetical protein
MIGWRIQDVFKATKLGHDTRALQAYLRHRNIQHTVRYTELAPTRALEGGASSRGCATATATYACRYREKIFMARTFMISAAVAVLILSSTAFAQQPSQFGNADEAKGMLAKAIGAVKADKAKALDMFNKGENGFLDRDLYVFCNNVRDAKAVANGNPQLKQFLGTDTRDRKDSTGKAYGLELYAAGQKPEGEITEVSYLQARPSNPTPVPKVSIVTRIGDIYCGVGYYK